MKKPLYKRAWFFLVVALAAVVLALIFWFGLKIAGVLIDSANWQKNIPFEEYKDDLNVLAEYVTENFQPSENDLDLKTDDESQTGYLLEAMEGVEYQLPTEVGEAIVRLRLANNPDLFPDDLGGVDYLNYHDDGILQFYVEAHTLCVILLKEILKNTSNNLIMKNWISKSWMTIGMLYMRDKHKDTDP